MFTEQDNEQIDKAFEPLRLASLKRCANQEEYETVLRAFEFARKAHDGIRRRSGEPYILHPIAVARVVVQEIGLGYKSIVTALLHDIVEDTDYTTEDISRLFGPKIASLVEGLTKIKSTLDAKHSEGKGKVSTGNENNLYNFSNTLSESDLQQKSMQAENFKRILLTLNDDVRVILIKLADRLHNLRTIDSMPARKMDKILSETMYIFIPLALRLGLYSIKSEMENIWLKYKEPESYVSINKQISGLLLSKGCDIDNFIIPLEALLNTAGYTFTISKRVKTPYSIWRKMTSKNITFDQIYDLFAIRIVFESKPDKSERMQCWDIYSLISEDYPSKLDRLRDWVSNPKSNGYEALHCTLMSPQGNWVEVQIRSVRMNDIAEKGVAAHWYYKGIGKSDSDMDKWLNRIKEVLQNPNTNALEFLDQFHAGLVSSEIFVFTPKGRSVRMTKGATALDFAYEIHSEIGNKAIAAKVNLKLVSLSYVLRNGDQVEIITAESQRPKREWLNFAVTSKAKNYIYMALKSDIKNAMKEGQSTLKKKLNELGVKLQSRVINKLDTYYNLNNREELYTKIGTGLIDLSDLDSVLKKNSATKFVKFWKLQFFNSDKNKGNEIPAHSIDIGKDYLLTENSLNKTLSYKIAECCNPIPGDPITGFIGDNGQVIIHKRSCPVAMKLGSNEGSKIINAKWTKHTVLSFLASIELKGIDRIGIVNDITKYITLALSVNIRKIFFETHDGIFSGYLELYVHNTEDLELLMKRIQKINGVKSVIRGDIKENEK